MANHARFEKAMERLFVKGLRPSAWTELRQHLEQCVACRSEFNRLALVKRELSPHSGPVPLDELDLIGQQVVEGAKAKEAAFWALPWRLAGPAWAAALVAVIAAGTMALRRPAGDAYQARGHAGQAASGIRAYCIDLTGSEPRLRVAGAPGPSGQSEIHCALSDALQFSYSAGKATELAIVGVEPQGGAVHHYFPAEQQQGSASIARGAVDEPVSWSTKLSAAHGPGRVRVLALFSAKALSAAEVSDCARRVADGGTCASVEAAQSFWLDIE